MKQHKLAEEDQYGFGDLPRGDIGGYVSTLREDGRSFSHVSAIAAELDSALGLSNTKKYNA